MGLYHEQAFCGRSNFVNITTTSNPAWYDEPYRQNWGEACGSPYYGNYSTLYDFSSIMQYAYGTSSTASTTVTMSRKSSITLPYCGNPDYAGYATGLSKNDISALNQMYGRGTVTTGC